MRNLHLIKQQCSQSHSICKQEPVKCREKTQQHRTGSPQHRENIEYEFCFFSRQGKHRKFSYNTGKKLDNTGKKLEYPIPIF